MPSPSDELFDLLLLALCGCAACYVVILRCPDTFPNAFYWAIQYSPEFILNFFY